MTRKSAAQTEISPRAALLSLIIFVLAAGGVVTAVVKLSTGTPARERDTAAPAAGAVDKTAAPAARAQVLSGSSDYSVIVSRNLFRSLGKAPVVPPPPLLPLPTNTVATAVATTVPPYRPITQSPFATQEETTPVDTRPKLALTGVVELGGDTFALVENVTDRQAQYIRAGSEAFGCKIISIAHRSAVLEYAGTTFTLEIGENKPDEAPTPPASPAPGGAGTAGTTPNGQPSNPEAGNAGAGMPGGDAAAMREAMRERFNRRRTMREE